LLTIQDVARQLQIKRSTIYAWVAEAKIPFFKVHGLIRFRQDDINGWVESFRGMRTRPVIRQSRGGGSDIDAVIARAKRQVYSLCPGDQTDAEEKGA
ncbi:MAG: helix-turn-helix domain-containing protein, partial [Nitrospirota bacterium]|nr:helix-turn-helix domain-containing protein [Nitrospirota bacterium]